MLGDRRARWAFVVLAALSAGFLLALTSHLSFIGDDWNLLVVRRGWNPDVFLDPISENIVLGSAVVYRILESIFGISSALPYYVVSIATFVLSAWVLFRFVERRLGSWPALIAAALILFLGAAFEDLLWAFQLCYFASMAAGIGMILALDRDDDAGDRLACLLLVVSIVFSNLGIAFAIGFLAEIWMNPRPWRGRIPKVAIPLGLFAVWWLGWGHKSPGTLSLYNLGESPEFVLRSIASGFTSLLGLATGDGSEPDQPNLMWGVAISLGAAAAVILRIRQLGRCPRPLAMVLVIAGALWFLTALNRADFRFPTSSRYQYIWAMLILLILAESLRGITFSRPALIGAAAVAVASALGGISLIEQQYAQHWAPTRGELTGSLGALQIAGDAGNPKTPVILARNITVPLSDYLEAVDADGSPGDSPTELADRPVGTRNAADIALARAEGLALAPPPPGSVIDCQRVDGGDSFGVALEPGIHPVVNRSDTVASVLLARFGDEFPVSLGQLEAGDKAALSIPSDGSSRPWRLGVAGGEVDVCSVG